MKYIITQLKLEEAVVESMRGNRVFMIDLDSFEKIREINYMPVIEVVSANRDHDVVFIMLQLDYPCGSKHNG